VLTEALEKVVRVLDALHVPYALIGGLAGVARGVIRATKDVDLLIDWRIRNAASLAESLNKNGLPATFHKGGGEDPVAGLIRLAIPSPTGPVRCDLLFPAAAWQAGAVKRATPVEVGGFVIPVAQSADLFLLKLYAGGPRDLLDAADLLRMQTPPTRDTWETAASKLGMKDKYKRCLKFLREAD
jgi:hypothetical protein